jgi:hypothetical protein
MTTDNAAKPQETKVTQLAPNRLMHAEHAHQTFVAAPEAGTPPEALLASAYWAHYSVNPNLQMKAGDHILVQPEDGTYFMELLVRSTYRGGVNLVELRRVIFEKGNDRGGEDFGDHLVKWSGPRLKWTVQRKADKRQLCDNHETKQAAVDWLREHLKVAA